MNREYHKWYSHRLNREMELLIFGHSGAKVLVFPTRCGRFYEYENMGLVEALRHKIEQGQIQLYCQKSTLITAKTDIIKKALNKPTSRISPTQIIFIFLIRPANKIKLRSSAVIKIAKGKIVG